MFFCELCSFHRNTILRPNLDMCLPLCLIISSLIISSIIFAISMQSIQRANTQNSHHARHNQKTLSAYLHIHQARKLFDVRHKARFCTPQPENTCNKTQDKVITKLECSKFIQLLYRKFRMYLVARSVALYIKHILRSRSP